MFLLLLPSHHQTVYVYSTVRTLDRPVPPPAAPRPPPSSRPPGWPAPLGAKQGRSCSPTRGSGRGGLSGEVAGMSGLFDFLMIEMAKHFATENDGAPGRPAQLVGGAPLTPEHLTNT